LTEKEKSKYMTEISDLKAEIEDFKIKLENTERNVNRLLYEIYRIKNYSLWDKVKFLFKKKGEIL
jgi:peptidoglycan hydrolase CwlO-like protein